MRFNWLEALCVLAIAIMLFELHPLERTVRLLTGTTASSQTDKTGLVAENATRRQREDLRSAGVK